MSWGYNIYQVSRTLYFLASALVVIVLVPRWRGLARTASILLRDSPTEHFASIRSRLFWPIAGLAGMCSALAFLELRQPYYFTQDDNIAQFLPGILQACRSLAPSIFPSWNPYQFLGSPNTSVGTYALTYPPTWLSYWLAKYVLRDEYATIEVFTMLHLVAGYLIIYWAVRREGVRPALATLAALCCGLSGYALLVDRSWYYMSPIFVWVPLLIICLQTARVWTVGWKWIVACGLVIGIFPHAGNVQMWAYSLIFFIFAAGLMLWTRELPLRSLAALATSVLLGLAIAAPLLVPQLLATRNVGRRVVDAGVLEGLPTLFVPVTVIQTWHPLNWGAPPYKEYLGEMYYSGTIFCVAGAALLLCLIFLRWRRPVVAQNLWFLCALVAFLFALGNAGWLWPLLQRLPGFSKFSLPFKFLMFFNIFMALAGAVAWERLLRRWRVRLGGELATVIVVSALLAYHCVLALPSFFNYGFRPYLPPAPGIAERLQSHDGRNYPKVLPVGLPRSTDADYLQSLHHQWPSLYGFFSAEGYDPLVSEDRVYRAMDNRLFVEPAAWLREYGVRFVTTYAAPWPKWLKVPATPVYRLGLFTLWELAPPRPMAWADAQPERPLPVKFDGSGADLDTSELPQGGWVTLSMIRRPEISASGEKRGLVVVSDSWSRIRIQVPAGVEHVRISFTPAWKAGFAVAALLALLAALAGWIYQRLPRGSMNQPGPKRDREQAVERQETVVAEDVFVDGIPKCC
jgi:hypothetical protein